VYVFSLKLGWLPSIGLDGLKNYFMPVAALAFYPAAYITRLMRSSMLDVLGQDYMRTAQAKGLPWAIRIFKHALRNAIGPIVTYLGPALAFILTGSFVVEGIFTIPGLGNSFVSSITNRDYTVIMGTTLFLSALLIGFNIVSDVLNKALDRRIQLK
jgi:oligopeptide transport system permease protein